MITLIALWIVAKYNLGVPNIFFFGTFILDIVLFENIFDIEILDLEIGRKVGG